MDMIKLNNGVECPVLGLGISNFEGKYFDHLEHFAAFQPTYEA